MVPNSLPPGIRELPSNTIKWPACTSHYRIVAAVGSRLAKISQRIVQNVRDSGTTNGKGAVRSAEPSDAASVVTSATKDL